jgi:hypothetical protein
MPATTYPSGANDVPFTISSFSSMADYTPDVGYQVDRAYNSIIFESEAGYEKRRLRSRRPKRSINLSYTNVTGLQKTAIENFYAARGGEYDSFNFDLSHLNDSGTITVRFDGSLQVSHVLSSGSNLLSNFYTISFKLKETYD